MSELSERHEVRIRGRDNTITFVADSDDGRLVIRQERDGKSPKEMCAITLSNPPELKTFINGLRRILTSLEQDVEPAQRPSTGRIATNSGAPPQRAEDRDVVVAARQRDPQAFAPWTREEEQEIRKRHAGGEGVDAIARAHKRSRRAIELRLQRLGALPREE
jgi:hypothetical protein